MKKNLSRLALILALAMTLSGCSGKTPPTGTITPNTSPAVVETQVPTEAPAETEEVSVSLGRIAGGVYENAYTGYGCKLNENWEYHTAEELQSTMDLTQDILQDSEMIAGNPKYQTIMDMMAENLTDLTAININYTYLSPAACLEAVLMPEEQMIDVVLNRMDELTDTYAQANLTLLSLEKRQVSFLGRERWALCGEYTIASGDTEIPYYTIQLFDVKRGGTYEVVLTLASYVEDNTESLLDLFYSLS